MTDKDKNKIIEEDLNKLYSNKGENELRAKWSNSLKEDYQIEKKKNSTFQIFRYAVAAILIIGIGTFTISFFLVDKLSNSSDAFIAEFEVVSNPNYGQRNAEEVQTPSLLKDAYQDMLQEDYQSAILNYNLADEQGELGTYEHFNLALSYLKTNQTEKSIPLLNKIVNEGSIYQEESNWLLSLAYIKAKQNQRAKDILINIIKSKSYKFKQAQQLLELIN